MVSSQCVCLPFDDKCSATGEGQRGLCEANNNHPVLGDQRHVRFLFSHEQCLSLKILFFSFCKKSILVNITLIGQVCVLLRCFNLLKDTDASQGSGSW